MTKPQPLASMLICDWWNPCFKV